MHSLLKKSRLASRWILLAGAGLAAFAAQAQVQGVSDGEIVIGTHLDLSGPLAGLGVPFRDGLILAAEEINAAGGIHGRKIRLVIEDNGYDPKKAVLTTQKMLTQDKVFALIATLGSATTSASQPLALDRGVPFLFPGSASESTYVPHHPLKFAFSTPFLPQIALEVKYAYEKLGKRRFGIIYQDDDTGMNVVRAVEDQLKLRGLSPTERASYKRGEIDYSAQIARLKAANVDVVMIGGNQRETASAEIEAKKQSWNVDMMCSSGASSPVTIKLGGAAVEGLYCTTQFMNSAQEVTPALAAIRDRYKARFGYELQDGVSQTYSSMMLFAEGARNAGRDLTPHTIQEGLEKVKNFKTVFEMAPVSYAPGNHLPPQKPILMQVKAGKWVPLPTD